MLHLLHKPQAHAYQELVAQRSQKMTSHASRMVATRRRNMCLSGLMHGVSPSYSRSFFIACLGQQTCWPCIAAVAASKMHRPCWPLLGSSTSLDAGQCPGPEPSRLQPSMLITWLSCMQEPKARPSAKYLLQHKFVVAPRPSLAAAALLPLIARSRDALQAMAAESEPLVAPPSSRSAGHSLNKAFLTP